MRRLEIWKSGQEKRRPLYLHFCNCACVKREAMETEYGFFIRQNSIAVVQSFSDLHTGGNSAAPEARDWTEKYRHLLRGERVPV